MCTEAHALIGAVKVKIADKAGIPADQLALSFAGQRLQDDWSVGDYGIERGSTIGVGVYGVGR